MLGWRRSFRGLHSCGAVQRWIASAPSGQTWVKAGAVVVGAGPGGQGGKRVYACFESAQGRLFLFVFFAYLKGLVCYRPAH